MRLTVLQTCDPHHLRLHGCSPARPFLVLHVPHNTQEDGIGGNDVTYVGRDNSGCPPLKRGRCAQKQY